MEKVRPVKGDSKLLDLTYVFGIALIISAIIYFFASNWGGLERIEKIGLIACLLAGLYLMSFFFERYFSFRPLVGKIAFFAGVISFGVSAALLGQMYNSHANSYLLFLVWLIPSLLFSILTRLQMLDVLSYILFHLTVAFYLLPTMISGHIGMDQMLLYLIALSLLNGSLFLVITKKWLHSPALKYMSFIMFHLIWFMLTVREAFPGYALFLHLSYNFIAIGTLYLFIKKDKTKKFAVLTVIAYALYLFEFLFSWMIIEATEWLFVFNMLIAAALIVLAIYFIRWMRTKVKLANEEEDGTKQETVPWWQRLIVEVISLFSALLMSIACFGLMFLLLNDFQPNVYVGIGLAFLVGAVLLKEQLNEIISHTIIYIGLLFCVAFSWGIFLPLSLAALLVILLIWVRESSRIVRLFVHLSFNAILLLSPIEYSWTFEGYVILLLAANGVLLIGSKALPAPKDQKLLFRSSLFYSLLFGFVLTFLYFDHAAMYYIVNGLFFIITTIASFLFLKNNKKNELIIVLLFWFAYLFYKYYDLVWKLLHKSIALLIIGAVILLIAIILDRNSSDKVQEKSTIWIRKLPILIVIALQFIFIGYQYAANEKVLADGDLIQLQLEPVDPRSLLQGDYVVLNYQISQIPEITEEIAPGEKVSVILTPNEEGLYEYKGIYKHRGEYNVPYTEEEGDVLINAKVHNWNQLIYGIETFFVEEGTGLELERNATRAYVKVAANGNAIVEKID